MARRNYISIALALGLAGPIWGQGLVPSSGTVSQLPRWKWVKGQSLSYQSEQVTHASDVINNNRIETSTRLQVLKRWDVLAVDKDGIGTLQLKLRALKLETTTPGGEALTFDSTNPEKGTPQLRDKLA